MKKNQTRRGFTLVELLVVTLIVLLLAGISVTALAGALEQAKIQRTQSQIARIHQVIMARYESIADRRLPPIVANNYSTYSAMRVDAFRALARAELPDRISDICDVVKVNEEWQANVSGNAPSWFVPNEPTRTFSRTFYRRVQATQAATGKAWTAQYEGAECLYMILSLPMDDGTIPLESFPASEIGDKDGDGFPEIWDAWGNPIDFIRWAPDFVSPLQPQRGKWSPSGQPKQFLEGCLFDPDYLRYNPQALPDYYTPSEIGVLNNLMRYRLVPLIFSAGPDGHYHLAAWRPTQDNDPYQPIMALTNPPNDPFWSFVPPDPDPGAPDNPSNPAQVRLGRQHDWTAVLTQGWHDNLHNHFLDGAR